MESFRKLGIEEHLIKVIGEKGFKKPSEIQEKSIPPIVSGKDVIAESATGSGKTLAFGVKILQSCEKGKGIQALVLTPTRELANQITTVLREFSKYKFLNICPVYGGVSINPQMQELRRADVVIGTPGRVLDHLERRTIDLSKVRILVLDEADRMLDMGFIDDVEKIIHKCQRERQTLLFSATMPSEIVRLASRHMRTPVRVSAEIYVDEKNMEQVYYDVNDKMKFSLLVHLLKNEKAGLVMVFCNTRRNVDFVAKNLHKLDIDSSAIHGGLSQNKRERTMEKFHSKNVYVLVCTDVAARGLDINDVSHVYNYDLPKDSKDYIHRIGRTARAGKNGKVINILASRDYENFSRVQRDNDVKIKKEEMPQIEVVRTQMVERSEERRGFGGRRFGSHGEGRRFGARKDSERKRDFGDRMGGEAKKFGWGEKREGFGHDRKFGGRREESGQDRKPFGEKRFGGERKFGGEKRDEGFGHDRKFGGRRDEGRKPSGERKGGFGRGTRGFKR